eukprot:CAMPEP_0182464850 /NCGR_PEP_ID=MMETSP1319-20130603/8868_1 /TAXON_ID=172717 /ORGANISM="Bolidomonas pacifica, Strain RCC208" /LENGTH=67 /DNA_ID=CAMNT_0024664519 /DNA_START=77 /DNA_END=278 /DNA_ORIENTATION=+
MEGTDIVLPDDGGSDIVPFVDVRRTPGPRVALARRLVMLPRDEDMLARDKAYVLRCWLALGGKEDTL